MKTRKYIKKGGFFRRKKTRGETGNRRKKTQKTQVKTKVENAKKKLKEFLNNLKNQKKKLDDANIVFTSIDNDMQVLIKDGNFLTKKKIKDIENLKKQRIKIKEMLDNYSADIDFYIREEGLDSDDEYFEIAKTRESMDRSFNPEYKYKQFSP